MEMNMGELDNVIHQPARLQIMASLVALGAGEQMEFVYLRELLKLTDGNLGAHLTKLEEAKYVRIEKTFIARKPKTFVAATDRGRDAFSEHVKALRDIIGRRK
jgi:DNA-binding MarR family transcriptional regulator